MAGELQKRTLGVVSAANIVADDRLLLKKSGKNADSFSPCCMKESPLKFSFNTASEQIMDSLAKLSPIPASTAAAIPTDLALVPLRFNSQGECDNDAALDRVIEVLSSQNSDDTVKAAIFTHAQDGNYKQFLNRLIRTIDDRHGPGTVTINRQVAEILEASRIMLVSDGGTVKMLTPNPISRNLDRQRVISETLASILPQVLTDIITLFDDEISYSQLSRKSIIDIFRSGDPKQKSMIIEAACEQNKLLDLNSILNEIGVEALNMAGVDLSSLARQSLRFHFVSKSNYCSTIITILIGTITDKNSNELATAQFLKNVFDHEYQPELNKQLANYVRLHGVDSVRVNDNIKRILAEKGIELVQSTLDGSIELRGEYAVADEADQRPETIDRSLDSFPAELTNIIAQYDKTLKICEKNQAYILGILNSDDPVAKGELIAAASRQGQIKYLSAIMRQMRKREEVLDLSNVNLQGLNLTGINLSEVNLTNANLQGTILSHAVLVETLLINANLNGAILEKAYLVQTDLSGASMIGADFDGAQITSTKLPP